MQLDERLGQIHQCLVRGRGSAAIALLREIKQPPRSKIASIAQLAWRAGIAEMGVKLLNPIVRADRRIPGNPSPEERAEYAQCLIRLAIIDEARAILSTIDPATYPRVALYRAASHVARWEYEKALPLLVQYSRAKSIDPYQRLVARVNWVAAEIYTGNTQRATMQLRELLYETSLRGFWLLNGNCLELSAQALIQQKKWKQAKLCLDRADKALAQMENLDRFFVRKWRVLAAVARSHGNRRDLRSLAALKRTALRQGHYETVRQCDEYRAIATGDQTLARFLYFGTPFESFRRQLQTRIELEIPDAYPWKLASGRGPVIDILRGQPHKRRGEPLATGGLVHRLLIALTQDFYRPIRLAALFAQIYPAEFFHPRSSPLRVYEAIRRARAYLKAERIPLRIEERSGAYRLTSKRACTLIIPRDTPQRLTPLLDRIRQRWAREDFSATQVSAEMGKPYRTTQRLLEQARSEGALTREGRGRSTRYRFKS